MLWVLGAGLIIVWLFLKVVFHKGDFIHVLLVGGISLLIIQFAAYRKARYQRNASGR